MLLSCEMDPKMGDLPSDLAILTVANMYRLDIGKCFIYILHIFRTQIPIDDSNFQVTI